MQGRDDNEGDNGYYEAEQREDFRLLYSDV